VAAVVADVVHAVRVVHDPGFEAVEAVEYIVAAPALPALLGVVVVVVVVVVAVAAAAAAAHAAAGHLVVTGARLKIRQRPPRPSRPIIYVVPRPDVTSSSSNSSLCSDSAVWEMQRALLQHETLYEMHRAARSLSLAVSCVSIVVRECVFVSLACGVRSLVYSFVRSFARPFIRSFVRRFVRSLGSEEPGACAQKGPTA
jgi:hypothetical protein